MEDLVPGVENEISKSIKPIDKQTVHQICSGQVVLDLSTAVKELVENSIDAGANNVEIRLREYGKETIEVSDNGLGIKEGDFEALALKHYTSKLREFNDLPSVSTFGFRGEALSSLSALGDLIVTTHDESSDVGSKLVFDHNGKLVERSLIARERGTTVSISNLFHTLPVRHKEFQRNYKKDFSKLMNVLYAFCMINGKVRINCVNHVGTKKNKLISTSGKNSVLDTISTIFGVNQVKNLIKIEQKEPLDTVLEEYNISKEVFGNYGDMFVIDGHISSVVHGCGRSVTDRQFLFINNRPCDFPKLARVINEVYHIYNNHQYPFVFLNMSLNKDYVDVNVTPDKRQIMIQQENILLVIIKSTLKQLFEVNATFFAENRPTNNLIGSQMNGSPISSQVTSTPSQNMIQDGIVSSLPSKYSPVQSVLDKFKSKVDKSPMGNSTNSVKSPLGESKFEKFSLGNESNLKGDTSPVSFFDKYRSKYEQSPLCNSNSAKKQKISEQTNLMSFFGIESKKRKVDEEYFEQSVPKKPVFEFNENLTNNSNDDISLTSSKTIDITNDDDNDDPLHKSNGNVVNLNLDDDTFDESNLTANLKFPNSTSRDEDSEPEDVCIVDEVASSRPSITEEFNLLKIREDYARYISKQATDSDMMKGVGSFHAKISVNDNQSAEEELGKNVTKEMFLDMDVIGQFNLGFLITKLKNNLFIVDQHATDEKYNYETLQRKQCLKGQRLIRPIPMNLTLVNESILIDNLEIFQKNGFEFEIKEDDELESIEDTHVVSGVQESSEISICNGVETTDCTTSSDDKENIQLLTEETRVQPDVTVDSPTQYECRIKLLTVPTSRNWTFSVDDVEELIYLLTESPGVMCRPSRVHKMFASRACRKSVMIGTALNKQQMKRLMMHMAEIDHPWNCPHGRPTMRHLVDLNRVDCN